MRTSPLRCAPFAASLALLPILATSAAGQDDPAPPTQDERLERLERELGEVRGELAYERTARERDAATRAAEVGALLDEIEALGAGASVAGGETWADRLTLGGYGEHHFNFTEGGGGDVSDIHRFVLYAGYRFADWIQLQSETEIEHAFVSDGDGEISIEQLFVDFLIDESFSVRAGRVLAPLGIINERHEPTTFYSVERPTVETVLIPSTWSLDGAGFVGRPDEQLAYQLYVTAGLDGSGFDGVSGIRGGRIKERPSLNEPAVSGRADWWPLLDEDTDGDLRVGASFYRGGVDNGDQGADPGLDGDVTILAGDVEYAVGDVDLRGVYVWERIGDAAGLNAALSDASGDPGIATELRGWYVEAGWHVMPDDWKAGKLAESDLVAFARYEDVDTQAELPANATADPRADRDEVTVGLAFFLTSQLVVKADYQILDDETSGGVPERLNLGFGYRF